MMELPSSVEAWGPLAWAALLAVARPLAITWVAPVWGGVAVGPRVRVLVAAGLAVVLWPVGPNGAERAAAGLGVWPAWLAWELVVGAGLGLAAGLVLAGARQAGELVGMQAGLAAASLLDPDAPGLAEPDEPLTPLGHLYGLIATAVFLVLDGPLRMVDALAASYQVAPPGWSALGGAGETGAELFGGLVPHVFGRVGATLGLALQAAAPAGLGTLLAGLVVALLARSAGARPLSGLAWPARAALGVGLTLASLGVLAATLAAAWDRWAAEFAP